MATKKIEFGVKLKFCATCRHWDPESEWTDDDTGECRILSAPVTGASYDDVKRRGVIGWPICPHDGHAITFETMPTFGCIYWQGDSDER